MGHELHEFHDREDGLVHCKKCNGAEGSLPTHCPGETMSGEDEELVFAGQLDFIDGNWVEIVKHDDKCAIELHPLIDERMISGVWLYTVHCNEVIGVDYEYKRLEQMLHGLVTFTHLGVNSEAYKELVFLRDMVSGGYLRLG